MFPLRLTSLKALGYNNGLDVSFDLKQAIIDYYPRPINGGLLFGVKNTNLPVTLEGFILFKNMTLERKGNRSNEPINFRTPKCPKELVDLMNETSDQLHNGEFHLFFNEEDNRWEFHLNRTIIVTSEDLIASNIQNGPNPKPSDPLT